MPLKSYQTDAEPLESIVLFPNIVGITPRKTGNLKLHEPLFCFAACSISSIVISDSFLKEKYYLGGEQWYRQK